jgi:hypothetical protein
MYRRSAPNCKHLPHETLNGPKVVWHTSHSFGSLEEAPEVPRKTRPDAGRLKHSIGKLRGMCCGKTHHR